MVRWFLVILCLSLAGCALQTDRETSNHPTRKWMTENGRLKVLSTTAMIGDLVQQVGGSRVDNLTLIGPGLDPHAYQFVKGDDEKVAFAEVIFYSGLGLEHAPSLQEFFLESPKAIPLGDLIREQYPERILTFNGQIDPHIWMDISLWVKAVPMVVEVLAQKDPAGRSHYVENGRQLSQELETLHQRIKKTLLSIPSEKRFLVTSHDAFNYFARAYLASPDELDTDTWQKRFQAPEGLAPDSQLSAQDIRHILDHLQDHSIQVLFAESNVSRDSIKKLLDAGTQSGLKLAIAKTPLFGDAMSPKGGVGDTYAKMMQYNARAIHKGLMGTCVAENHTKEERE